jgi:hypothetical protein
MNQSVFVKTKKIGFGSLKNGWLQFKKQILRIFEKQKNSNKPEKLSDKLKNWSVYRFYSKFEFE